MFAIQKRMCFWFLELGKSLGALSKVSTFVVRRDCVFRSWLQSYSGSEIVFSAMLDQGDLLIVLGV
ncbi:hypothetical protein CpB0872 [Chlamydia pneumoniae TW-183]|uniref:Uncharacterized protein n=1 Tax=Chlamydia pneumoniae TaxID=83558 RepID=A0ABN3YQC7_CHLPN|nr:hypothetical protein CpB0872 [Chlamydia pneumoniae TW-183]